MHTVTRHHDISCGHRVLGHAGQCAHLHGHNYRVHFTCTAKELDALGIVIDFGAIKSGLCQWLDDYWDHRMLLWGDDPLYQRVKDIDESVVKVPFNPTAEAMAAHLVTVVGPYVLENTGVTLISCKVEETRKCSATYSL